ncbi:hypothetical protein CEP52_008468 [Fusarium oligoseptatum]|uniref:Leucine-rich repeat domain-containing protein n=1 Tax=Fusarium oligoseptatum TaxID=2604345 RepID=A0A428THR8_9HYPO|nr:hypothetical protein CEP52_008468 [Fusarium oligoseptatum]
MAQIQPQSHTSPIGLLDLPLDLLLPIIQSFCFHCRGEPNAPYPEAQYVQDKRQWPHASPDPEDQKALLSLCLVSKEFRSLAQNVMYHDIRLERANNSLSPSADWKLPTLLQTIISRPDLARVVKSLRVNVYYTVEPRIDDIWDVCEQAAETLGLTLPGVWHRWAKGPREDLPIHMEEFFFRNMNDAVRADVGGEEGRYMVRELLKMLLALLPNLEHANIEPELPSPAAMRALGIESLPWKEVTLWESSRLMEMATNVETLTVTSAVYRCPIPASVKTVRIHCQQTTQWFTECLQNCTGITSFSYQTSSEYSFCLNTSYFTTDVGEIIRFLHGCRTTLKSLYLDIRHRPCGPTRLKARLLVSSLKEYTVLEDLLLCSNSLFPKSTITKEFPSDKVLIDILPSSISCLSILHPGGRVDGRFKKVLLRFANSIKCNKAQFPNLKCIQCDIREICEGDDGAIKKAFEEIGIDLVYKEFPRYDWSYETSPEGDCLPRLKCESCGPFEDDED